MMSSAITPICKTSAALNTDGTVFAWGWDAFGKLDTHAGLSNAVAIGAGTVAVIWGLRRMAPQVPGMLVAVSIAAAAVAALGLPVETIGSVFGGLAPGLPAPRQCPVNHFEKSCQITLYLDSSGDIHLAKMEFRVCNQMH